MGPVPGLRLAWVAWVFPAVCGVNPSVTIQVIAIRTADRIGKLDSEGEL